MGDGISADGISMKQKRNKLFARGAEMLTDTALKALKPKDKIYKMSDRDGMYVVVKPTGGIVFGLDYRLNGRRETLTIGKYGRDGITLAEARERCFEARRAVRDGKSPAQEKQREKRKLREAKAFGEFAERYLTQHQMADSTRVMRRAIYDRDIGPFWKKRLLTEITHHDLRALCARVKERHLLQRIAMIAKALLAEIAIEPSGVARPMQRLMRARGKVVRDIRERRFQQHLDHVRPHRVVRAITAVTHDSGDVCEQRG